MTQALAECVDVSRLFGHFVAVDGVDLRLDRGEVVGLLGANGAGKTTTFYMLVGLERTEGGTIERPATRTRAGAARKGLRSRRCWRMFTCVGSFWAGRYWGTSVAWTLTSSTTPMTS